MTPVRILSALLAMLSAALSIPCAAAPIAVQLGDTRIVLDAPAGFADTTSCIFAASLPVRSSVAPSGNCTRPNT